MFYNLKNFEIGLTMFTQTHLQFLETIFEIISVEFGPTVLLTYGIPLLGSCDIIVMTKSSLIMGILALVCSTAKWICPGDRPFWWVRENSLPDLRQHRLTCETTGGFPSGHSAQFSAFIYLLISAALPILHSTYAQKYEVVKYYSYYVAAILCVLMWTSRIYFGCHFLHQCMFGSMLAVWLVQLVNNPRIEHKLLTMPRNSALLILLGLGIFLIVLYFVFLNSGIDPHWSVRMAFKWCDFPEYLKHETSPIYSIAKDYGFLMGVALSAPLIKRTRNALDPKLSLPITLFIMLINCFLNMHTPKQSGRAAFVIYGFTRNLLFSYALLNLVPILSYKFTDRHQALGHHLE